VLFTGRAKERLAGHSRPYREAKTTSRCVAEKRGVQVVSTSVGAFVCLSTQIPDGRITLEPVT
jgi:hypothetical protein